MTNDATGQGLQHETEDDRIAQEILDLGRREPLSPEESERLLRRIFEVMRERGHITEMPPPGSIRRG